MDVMIYFVIGVIIGCMIGFSILRTLKKRRIRAEYQAYLPSHFKEMMKGKRIIHLSELDKWDEPIQ